MHICITELLCCIAEINKILYINYMSIKIFLKCLITSLKSSVGLPQVES